MESRDGPGPIRGPPGMSSDCRGLPVFQQPGQAHIGRSQAQIENRIQHAGKPEIQQPSGIAGDGETRTRTGDTTIFSRAIESRERRRNPCKQADDCVRRLWAKIRKFRSLPRRFGRWVAFRLPLPASGRTALASAGTGLAR